MILFEFAANDPGNCRVYYRNAGNVNSVRRRHLYCIQNDGSWGKDKFVFYTCSRDGEPSHEIRMPLDSSFDRKVMPRSVT
jgi:hypothetical protein